MGYACAYPLGVMGIILSMIIIRYICRVDVQRDSDEIQNQYTKMANSRFRKKKKPIRT